MMKLYNGIKLPALPETAYKYMTIHKLTVPGYYSYQLDVTTSPCVVEHSILFDVDYTTFSDNRIRYAVRWNDGESVPEQWEEPIEKEPGSELAEYLVWANHDIYYEDGKTLYLPASEPVPVTQLNPAALMQGFATMLSVRRNRNG